MAVRSTFYPSAAWLLLTILQFLSYKIFIDYKALGVWHFDALFQWLTYAPFYALLAWEIFRGHRQTLASQQNNVRTNGRDDGTLRNLRRP